MVSVVVLQPFTHAGHVVFPGAEVEMTPIDAAVHARSGHVSLLHGRTYQTREMRPAEPPDTVVQVVVAEPDPPSPEPPKRRRGRPRKTQA